MTNIFASDWTFVLSECYVNIPVKPVETECVCNITLPEMEVFHGPVKKEHDRNIIDRISNKTETILKC